MTMPRHRAVPTLQSLSLNAVGSFVVALKPRILAAIDLYSNPQASLRNSVEWLKNILVANIPLYIYDDMAEHVLVAVKDLIDQTKKSYFPHINMVKFMTEMNVVVGLTEVVLNKYLKSIDFSLWPKIMRYVLYRNLFRLSGLEILNLGSCTGGWQSSEYEKFIIDGISRMKNLRSLCLCFDCSDSIIQSLGEHCPNLQCLDVTSSRSVTDRSVPHLLKCTQLYQLQLNRTSITIRGFAQILLGLKKLQDIGRCDEFGAVLNFLKRTKTIQLALKRIHTRELRTEHLDLLVQFCPQVEHISLFHDEKFSDLRVLTTLYNLKDLKLLSCDFYADYMKQLLEIRGCNLTSLHLEHVEEIDLNALISISQYCPRLKNLVLYNCDFTDQIPSYNRYLKIKPFQYLERLFWVVDCALTQLEFVLLHCVNIKFIHLGSSTGICHNTMVKVMAVNPMKQLEELRILYSNDMNIETVNLLLANCPNLKVLSELENWLGITIGELTGFKKYIHSNNIDLDIRPILSY